MRHNGEHLLAILNDILDLSKVESGHLELEQIEFSLPRLLGEVVELMRVRARENSLELRVELESPIPAGSLSPRAREPRPEPAWSSSLA